MIAAIRPARFAVALLVALVAAALAATLVVSLARAGASDAGPAFGKGGFQWTPPPARTA